MTNPFIESVRCEIKLRGYSYTLQQNHDNKASLTSAIKVSNWHNQVQVAPFKIVYYRKK
jgi:hypothetical protein